MTGRPAPPALRGGPPTPWPPAALPGLHVHLGGHHRPPVARFTCRHGCTWQVSGVDEVAHFTTHITTHHTRHCPGKGDQTT